MSKDSSILSSLRASIIASSKPRIYLFAFFFITYFAEYAQGASDSLSDTSYFSSISNTESNCDSCDNDSGDCREKDFSSVDTVTTDSLLTEDTAVEKKSVTKNDSSKYNITPQSAVRWGQKRRVESENSGRYPGISDEQDKLARQMIHEIYSFDWNEADKIALKMQKLEAHDNLPPLSYLLMVSMRVVRIQNSEYENESEERFLTEQADKLAQEGMERSNPSKAPSKSKPTYLFIYSGIKGFYATLKINRNPVEAAIEGLSALRMLEKLLTLDPQIKDVYLGLGIFYCALAKAPAIVRGALNMSGKNISFERGIEYLQTSAYEGKYTCETAKQYLIQFLSPYMGNEAEEKNKIFKSLQQEYQKNPYYLFLEVNENICFHSDKNHKEMWQRVKKKLTKFKSDEYSIKRYAVLVQYQYCYFDSSSVVRPDTTFDLREFNFYPVFLEALKEKSNPEVRKRERYKRYNWSKNGVHAAKLLDESSMSLNRRNFFAWYIRDALRTEGK